MRVEDDEAEDDVKEEEDDEEEEEEEDEEDEEGGMVDAPSECLVIVSIIRLYFAAVDEMRSLSIGRV